MRTDTVSYLFTEAEMGALMEITSGVGLPLHSFSEDTFQAGVESLESSQLLARAGNQFILDRIAAFLVYCTQPPAPALCLQGEGKYLGLFYHTSASVVLEWQGIRWKVSPFPNLSEAESLFFKCAGSADGCDRLLLRNQTGTWQRMEPVQADLRQAVAWMASGQAPEGKEAPAWRQ